MSERNDRSDSWPAPGEQDEADEPQVKSLSPEEARAWRERHPAVSPWRVVRAQAVVGLVFAVVAVAVARESSVFWSALYGAVVVVVPSAVMARGLTSRPAAAAGSGAVVFMVWELVKLLVSVVLLLLAPKLLPHLSWLALLAAMVLCLKTYWVALLWRGRS